MKFQAASILKRVWLLAIVVLLAACANPDLACEDALGCVTVRPNEPIRIGYLLAESGEAAFLGADSKGGIELAIDGRATGVLDRQIELAGRDTGCDTDKGLMAAQTLTAVPSLIGIIGANCSHVAETVMPIVFDAGLVMLSPSNTAPNLTANQSWRGAYVRTAPSDWRQADAAAAFAYEELGGGTAVILHDGGEYASGLAAAFAASWRDRGGAVLFEHEIAVGQTDFDEALTGLAFSPPDVLYLPLFEPEAGAIANTLYGVSGLETVTLIGAENLLHPDFPQSAGAAVEGMYLTGTAVPSDEYDIFLAKWDVKFGGSPLAAYHAHAYDATNILLNAIEASAQESADGTLLIGRGALRQAIADTTDFAGLTGTLTCDAAGDCASEAALGIYQITAEEIAGTYWPPPLLWTP